MQTILLLARVAMVIEIFRRALGHYSGLWRLCRSILAVIAVVLVLAAAYQAQKSAPRIAAVALTTERGLELAIVGILLFAVVICRYYHWIALGIGLNSAVQVANNSLLQKWLPEYFRAWSSIRLLWFQIVTALWCAILWKPLLAPRAAPALFEREVYDELSPEVSRKLREMNSKLAEMLK